MSSIAMASGVCYAYTMKQRRQQPHSRFRGRVERKKSAQRQRAQWDELRSTYALLHELAWEIEEIQQRLDTLLLQREGPTDILVEREINELYRRRALLEDQMLHQMLRADELSSQINRRSPLDAGHLKR